MAAEAFAALEKILESRQRRESTDRQYALALMQFDYQKKQADMAQVGKQLELLQGANAQMMNNVAESFMSESGLDMIYSADDKGGEDAMDQLKDLGFTKNHAAKITSAVWSYHTAQNPQPILKLGRELKNIFMIDLESITGDQRRFANSLGGLIGMNGSEFEVEKGKELLNRTDKILQNQDDIMSEVYEYGTGDFEIQRKDIGLGLQQLAEEGEAADDDIPSIVSVPGMDELISSSESDIKTSEYEVDRTENALELLNQESHTLKEMQKRGALTDEQREYMARLPVAKQNLEEELKELNEGVRESRDAASRARSSKAQYQFGKLSDIAAKRNLPFL